MLPIQQWTDKNNGPQSPHRSLKICWGKNLSLSTLLKESVPSSSALMYRLPDPEEGALAYRLMGECARARWRKRKAGVRAMEMYTVPIQAHRQFLGKTMPWKCIDFFMERPRGGRATAAVPGECLSGLHLLHHLLQMGNYIVYCRINDRL